eukprot:GILK01000814.1.p1 GENE.GILK01000814.1~~GILK01000814.1.p1  ORF type:complete len:704 (-),score=116.86 GILK01000814.1:122-1960(-)
MEKDDMFERRETVAEQATPRAIVTGCALGAIVCCTNVYFGLKTGWGMGANLIVATLAFTVSRAFNFNWYTRLFGGKPFTAKENCVAQTAGVAAGSLSSACAFTSAIPALGMANVGIHYSYGQLVLWCLALAYFGLFFAVPLRKQAILRDKLKFPSGTATAESIRAMHSSHGAGANSKSMALVFSAVGAAVWNILCFFIVPMGTLPFFTWFGLPGVTARGLLLNTSPAFIGAGMFMGLKVTVSMLIGAALGWGVLGSIAVSNGWIEDARVGSWLLWVSVAFMVADALFQLANIFFVLVRSALARRAARKAAAGNLNAELAAELEEEVDPAGEDEQIPTTWWVGGLICSTALCTVLLAVVFDIPFYLVFVGLILGCILAIVGVKATGETDINPLSGVGRITQLIYAGLAPGDVRVNIVAAAMAAAGACQAADMMGDLKTGHILKAAPRAQFIAQIFGVAAGIVMAVPAWMLFSSAYEIPGTEFNAPSARMMNAVAELLKDGLGNLPPHCIDFAVGAFFLTWAINLATKFLPAHITKWIPSCMAVGIAMMVTIDYSIIMFLGALMFYWWTKKRPQQADDLGAAVASGLVLGEGLMGLVRAVFQLAGLKALVEMPE